MKHRKLFRQWLKLVDEWLEWFNYPNHNQVQPYEYWLELWHKKKRAYDAARWGIQDSKE